MKTGFASASLMFSGSEMIQLHNSTMHGERENLSGVSRRTVSSASRRQFINLTVFPKHHTGLSG